MTTHHPIPLTPTMARDALFADARRRAGRARQAALRLAWARLSRWVRRLVPAAPAALPLPQRKTC